MGQTLYKNSTFVPDEKVLRCADFVSKNFHKMGVGHYESRTGEYRIEIKDFFIDDLTGEKLNTCCRISNKNGVIQLNKEILSDPVFTKDVLFYLIIWGVIEFDVQDSESSDILAVNYYLTTGREKMELLLAIIKQFKGDSSTVSELNCRRLNWIRTKLV